MLVKRILRRYNYPPDKQEKDNQTVLQQVVTTDHGFPYDDYAHTISPIGSCP